MKLKIKSNSVEEIREYPPLQPGEQHPQYAEPVAAAARLAFEECGKEGFDNLVYGNAIVIDAYGKTLYRVVVYRDLIGGKNT